MTMIVMSERVSVPWWEPSDETLGQHVWIFRFLMLTLMKFRTLCEVLLWIYVNPNLVASTNQHVVCTGESRLCENHETWTRESVTLCTNVQCSEMSALMIDGDRFVWPTSSASNFLYGVAVLLYHGLSRPSSETPSESENSARFDKLLSSELNDLI